MLILEIALEKNVAFQAILFIGLLICYLKHNPQDQGGVATGVKVEYRKTGTPSGHDDDDAPSSRGGDAPGAQGGGTSAERPEDPAGGKASVHL